MFHKEGLGGGGGGGGKLRHFKHYTHSDTLAHLAMYIRVPHKGDDFQLAMPADMAGPAQL